MGRYVHVPAHSAPPERPPTQPAHSLRPPPPPATPRNPRSRLRRDRSSSKVSDAECPRVGGASARWRRDHSARRYRRLTTGQDFRRCAARPAVVSQDRGRRLRGRAESCTWESGASMTQDRLFPGISGFLYRRQDRLSCSHVHRPPTAHMGTRQLVLTESGEPQNHAENRRSPRRGPALPCAGAAPHHPNRTSQNRPQARRRRTQPQAGAPTGAAGAAGLPPPGATAREPAPPDRRVARPASGPGSVRTPPAAEPVRETARPPSLTPLPPRGIVAGTSTHRAEAWKEVRHGWPATRAPRTTTSSGCAA